MAHHRPASLRARLLLLPPLLFALLLLTDDIATGMDASDNNGSASTKRRFAHLKKHEKAVSSSEKIRFPTIDWIFLHVQSTGAWRRTDRTWRLEFRHGLLSFSNFPHCAIAPVS